MRSIPERVEARGLTYMVNLSGAVALHWLTIGEMNRYVSNYT